MAAPAFRARTMFPEALGTTLKLTVPATTVASDCLFAAVQVESKVTITGPAGWTEVATQKQAAIEEWTCSVWMLPNWNGTTTEYTWTWGGASKGRVACIWSVSGADTSSPVSGKSGTTIQENTPASTKATIAAYTVSANESRPFTVVFNNNGVQVTPGAGYTEVGDQANGPEICYKTEAVSAGTLAKVEHTISSSVTLVLGFSVQPPAAAPAASGLAMVI